jgi:hypothetical protein
MEAKDKKLKDKDRESNFSYSDLNKIRTKSVYTIRKIREQIQSKKNADDDNAGKIGHLRPT